MTGGKPKVSAYTRWWHYAIPLRTTDSSGLFYCASSRVLCWL
jgi:hypothetical protein